jgi:uncharacterized membrane protein
MGMIGIVIIIAIFFIANASKNKTKKNHGRHSGGSNFGASGGFVDNFSSFGDSGDGGCDDGDCGCDSGDSGDCGCDSSDCGGND